MVINGETWKVLRVGGEDPRLVDRTGRLRLATTDPETRTIHISSDLTPPLLDQVVLHEVAHAITVSWDMLGRLRAGIPPDSWVHVEEWSAKLVEDHALEAVEKASQILGRPVCVRGLCNRPHLHGKPPPWSLAGRAQ